MAFCADGRIFNFMFESVQKKFNNNSIILKKYIFNDKIVVNIWKMKLKILVLSLIHI